VSFDRMRDMIADRCSGVILSAMAIICFLHGRADSGTGLTIGDSIG
jgi:hypothetical protein